MKLRSYLLAAAAALALVGCGGGSGGGTATVPLSGTAAIGTPLAGADIVLRDADNRTSLAKADTYGRFTFPNVSGLTPPFMLRATGTVAGSEHKLYSFSPTLPTSGVLNATPLTNAVVQAALPSGRTLKEAFEADSLLTGGAVVNQAKLATAITNLQAALSDVFAALNVPSTDPFTTAFSANHTGLDRLLDLIEFRAEASGLRVFEKGNPQNAITVSVAADAPPLTPLAAPVAADVDYLTLLPRFVGRVNAWLGDANRTRADFDALVHAKFIDYGENRDQAFTFFTTQLLRPGTSVRIASYSVDGCKALPETNPRQIVCDLSFDINIPATENSPAITDVLEIPVIFVAGPEPVWQFFGNQALFDFSFEPVAKRTGTASPELGISIWMDPAAGAGTFSRADVALSINGRAGDFNFANWALDNKWDDYLVHDRLSGTFVAVPDKLDVVAFNAAVRAGNAWVRIRATPAAAAAGSQSVVDFYYRVDQELYTAETAAEAFRSANLQATWPADHSSVSLSGNRIEHVCTSFSSTTVQEGCSGQDFWLNPLSNLVVSPATARTACLRDHTAQECNASYPDDATVTGVLMVASENRTGRDLWQWFAPPVGAAEGHFSGTTAGPNPAFELLILENGEFWTLYGTRTPTMFAVRGFVQGTGSFANNQFTSADARDFGFFPATAATVASGVNATNRTISGSIAVTSTDHIAFQGGPATWSTYNYNTPASLATVIGAWTAETMQGERVVLTIGANGTFTAQTELGCSFTGTADPRSSGKNVFNFALTFGGSPCILAGQSGTGIAISYPLPNGGTQLVAAVTNSARTGGFAIFGVR